MVNTGDNLAHPRAVPAVLAALGPLLARPGVFVFGSNDYFGPRPKNPARYLVKGRRRIQGEPLPWRDLRAALTERGWSDVTHARVAAGRRRRARSPPPASTTRTSAWTATTGSPAAPTGQPALRLGLTHSPEPRVLDRFAADGYDLVLAGHTHGGQLRVPGVRRAGHQLRHRPLPGPRGVPVGGAHVAARLRRARHLAVRAGALRLPAGGQPADPGAAPGRRRPTAAGNPRVGRGGRRIELSTAHGPSGCGAAW